MTTQQGATQASGPEPSQGDVYVLRDGGPYSGRMSRLVGCVPGFLLEPVIQAGGMVHLLASIVWSAVRYPTGYWEAVAEDMVWTIRRAWFPIAAAVFGFLFFTSTMALQFFSIVGADQLFGPLLLLHSTRTFTVWVVAIVVAGVIGAALTTDIGTRKVREEIDAMKVMGIDPVREIAVPRVVSLTLMTVLLSTPAMLVTMWSMQLSGRYLVDMPASVFYSNLFVAVRPSDVAGAVIYTLFVGLIIGAICTYKGFTAAGGATGLGRAVNQAIVVSFIGVFVFGLAYQAVLLGFFPGAGALR